MERRMEPSGSRLSCERFVCEERRKIRWVHGKSFSFLCGCEGMKGSSELVIEGIRLERL